MCVIRDMITRPQRGLPGGVPSQIIPDNGVEFKNNSFARLCETLKLPLRHRRSARQIINRILKVSSEH